MLCAANTPNAAGLKLSGDFLDFQELYDALHELVGEEGDHPGLDGAQIRVLGLCYDIRHALMGDREAEFVENGMDEEIRKNLGILAPLQNIYLTMNTAWPEMLFIVAALSQFIRLRGRSKQCKYPEWDHTIQTVKKLQALVAKCLVEILSPNAYARLMKVLSQEYLYFELYTSQYLDLLNCRYFKMDREKRLKNLSLIGKNIVEKPQEYYEITEVVESAARQHNCTRDNIRLKEEYPENIEW